MRVNVEDDLWVSGRLAKLSRVLGWSERETLGALVMFYRRTQDAQIITAHRSAVVCAVVIDFDSDEWAEKFISAMVSAKLVTEDAVLLTIKGNEKHVARITTLRGSASAGGKARAAKMSNYSLSTRQPNAKHSGALPTPYSLLPTPSSLGEEEEIRDRDLPFSPKLKKQKEPPTDVAQVRRAFLDGYAARYPKADPYPWGKRENGQAKNWLASVPLAEALKLIGWFFKWRNAKAVLASHPFGTGPDCLILKYIELRGDIAHPERRAFAAEVQDVDKQDTFRAQLDAQADRVARKEQHERMERVAASRPERGTIGDGNNAALRSPQPQAVGRSLFPLEAPPLPAGEWDGLVESPRKSVR